MTKSAGAVTTDGSGVSVWCGRSFAGLRARGVHLLLLVLLVVQAGCLGDPQSPPDRSGEARAFLTKLVDTMQSSSIRRDQIDWVRFRDQVMARGALATTIEDALPAVQVALTLLGDNHSWVRRPDGSFLGYQKSLSCTTPAVTSLSGLPSDIGYVRVPAFGGNSAQAATYTTAIQDVFRSRDADPIVGWIIDLRGNTGGNMWPMLASLWPFLQGVTGHFIDADSRWYTWSVTGPRAFMDQTALAEATSPHQPRGVQGRVAVLLDGRVASSGEATAIAFRGRANTRSFGAPTCGLSTGIGTIPLDGNYLLGLASVNMADRDSVVYGGIVPVDEAVANADALAARAIAWIREGQN